MSQFAQRLKQLRQENHYTQGYVAKKLNLTVSALSQYENGRRKPQIDLLVEIADLYNTNVDYLLGVNDNKYSSTGKVSQEAAASTFKYDIGQPTGDNLHSQNLCTKARILNAINALEEKKQAEVLALIEMLLSTIS